MVHDYRQEPLQPTTSSKSQWVARTSEKELKPIQVCISPLGSPQRVFVRNGQAARQGDTEETTTLALLGAGCTGTLCGLFCGW